MTAKAPVQNISEALAQKNQRPVYVYTVPSNLGGEDFKTIGLVQLTAHEEMMAAKRSNGDPIKLAYEQVMQAIVEVNGEKVGVANGSADRAFNTMGPMLRNLVMTAHAKLHAPPEGDVELFLDSREVRLG